MLNTFNLEVITPEKHFYKGDVELVVVRTVSGDEGYMANHAWGCKLIIPGEMKIKEVKDRESQKSSLRRAVIAEGYIDIRDRIIIYTDSAEWAEDIELSEAQKRCDTALAEFEKAKETQGEGLTPRQYDNIRYEADLSKVRLRTVQNHREL